MKKLVYILLIAALFISCDRSSRGHLTGVQDRPRFEYADPPGMVFIPMGSFIMGPSDEDVIYSQTSINRTISIPAFYMDETEITNNQYREFVYWVRDSIARSWLYLAGHQEGRDEFGFDEDEFGNPIDPPTLNWRPRIRWNDQEVMEILEYLYIPEQERFFRRREINTDTLQYIFQRIDWRAAAQLSNRNASRAQFVKTDTVAVYPDTLVWIRDFTYTYNEPMATSYFWHPTYDHYPVVGVNWKQARAFTVWRTNLLNSYLASRNRPFAMDFLLPSEAEWEYAARGGLSNNPYPWGGPYTRNSEGCFLANFKPLRGNYVADGGYQTVIVAHYPPNDYGLYDMAGNVAEWTRNAYDESSYYIGHDMNPDYQYEVQPGDPPSMRRKVVRGGSWKDVAYYLQVSTRTYEYQDTAKSYIGFRCMQTFPGRDRADGRRASNVY